jgi:hypothetical protein
MRPEDIGRESITVHAGNTKTLKTRVVPIIPPVRKYLKHVPLALNFEGSRLASAGLERPRDAVGHLPRPAPLLRNADDPGAGRGPVHREQAARPFRG